jgi:hypothetical protein
MLTIITTVLLAFVPVGVVAAQSKVFQQVCKDSANASTVCTDQNQTATTTDNSIYGPNGVLTKTTNILTMIVAIVAVIAIVLAGIKYILSNGDPKKIIQSRDIIIYAIAGLFIVIIARSILIFVISKLN